MLTPGQMAKRWGDAMKRSDTVAKYKEGIDSVTTSPMEKAASPEAEAKFLQRVTESVTSGRRRARLMAVPLQRYKDNAKAKADRLQSGAIASQPKMDAHMAKFHTFYQQASDAAKAIQGTGRDAAKAKVNAVIDVLMDAAGRS